MSSFRVHYGPLKNLAFFLIIAGLVLGFAVKPWIPAVIAVVGLVLLVALELVRRDRR